MERGCIGEPVLNKYFFETFYSIYNEVFGSQFKYHENRQIMVWIKYTFWFKGDFKPNYYHLYIPAELIDDFPQLEEKFYRFGEKCMKADIRPFIEVQGGMDDFKGSLFEINFGYFNRYTSNREWLDRLTINHTKRE
jgi:hypothetical protein